MEKRSEMKKKLNINLIEINNKYQILHVHLEMLPALFSEGYFTLH